MLDDKKVIEKLDRDEIERNLRQELKGADIDKIAREVQAEVDEVAKKKKYNYMGGFYEKLFD